MANNKKQAFRTYELIIGKPSTGKGLQIIGDEIKGLGLNISFRIKKELNNSEKTNYASIDIFNLSDDSIKYIEEDKTAIIVKVGWNGDNKLLFTGIVDEIETEDRVGSPDRKTSLRCKPTSSLIYQPTISKTFPKNTSPRDIIEYLVGQSGSIIKSAFNSENVNKRFPFGYTVNGSTKEVLDQLAIDFNFNYRIDNKRLSVSDPNRYESQNSVSRAYQFTPETGLIGIPTYASADGKKVKDDKQAKAGVKFQALINPLVTPGSAVSIQDVDLVGIYRVNSVEYNGEWRQEQPWYMTCYCSKLKGSEV